MRPGALLGDAFINKGQSHIPPRQVTDACLATRCYTYSALASQQPSLQSRVQLSCQDMQFSFPIAPATHAPSSRILAAINKLNGSHWLLALLLKGPPSVVLLPGCEWSRQRDDRGESRQGCMLYCIDEDALSRSSTPISSSFRLVQISRKTVVMDAREVKLIDTSGRNGFAPPESWASRPGEGRHALRLVPTGKMHS